MTNGKIGNFEDALKKREMGKRKVMKTKGGDRLKAVRLLFGLGREEFADMIGISFNRYCNVEQKRAKLGEDEIAAVCSRFPEFTHWMAYEGVILVNELKHSSESLCRLVAAKIEAGQIPTGYFIEDRIK